MRKMLFAAMALLLVAGAANAADDKATAFKLCYKELTNYEGIPGGLVKKFTTRATGGRFEVTGRDDEGRAVVCTVHNGRVTNVQVG